MIVGFAGKLQSGKDTSGYRLLDKFGFTRISFAEALKKDTATKFRRTLKAHYRMTRPDLQKKEPTEKEWDEIIYRGLWLERDDVTRAMLQEVGTEVYRAVNMDWWVNRWSEEVGKVDSGHVVVTDTRFENEINAIKNRDGKLVKVIRPALQVATKDVSSHASENEWTQFTDWDAVVVNDGAVEDLWKKIDDLAEQWSLTPSKKWQREEEQRVKALAKK